MYCPHCATENLDSSSFCRGCGANIRLVSQALSGNLPAAPAEAPQEVSRGRRRRRGNAEPNVEKGIKNIFLGIAFVLVALAARTYGGAATWWFWLLIPAFMMLGGGVAELVRVKMARTPQLPAAPDAEATPIAAQPRPMALPRRNTAELIEPPPSVTENTTRHLDDLPTRHLETPVESKSKKV